jgi:DNA-binding CsgD family transcriptional regulator/tetratricopeptide (TPR) repeat protein
LRRPSSRTEKAAIHTKIIDALLSAGCNDDARLAFHAEGAGNAELVLAYAPRAGRRAAALSARREAAAQYERALRFVPETDIRRRAELLDSLAQQLNFVDRREDLVETCSAAVALWHELGDSQREFDSLLSLAGNLWWLCRGADSSQASNELLKLAESLGPSPQLAKAYHTLALRRRSQGRYEDSLAVGRQVREMSEQLGLADVISESLKLEALVVHAMGKDWTRPMHAALEIALSGGHEYQAGGAFADMYWLYCGELRHGEGEQIYDQAMAYCDVHDIGTFANCLLSERAGVFEKLGRWDECVSITHQMLEERPLSPSNRIQPLCYQAKVMARRGQDGFWPHLDEAMHLAIGLDEPEWLSFVGVARIEAYWLEGRLDAARAELARVRAASAGVVVLSRGWIALWTRRLMGIAEPIDLEPFTSQVAGDATHAAELWDRLGYRYEAAVALMETNEEALLRDSLARLSDLGAEAAARLVRQRMRDLGIRSIPAGARTATKAHPRGLTAREQQILELLSQGQSNEEISASLFISVRTVEHHVSAILGKLGVTTRKSAAGEALKLGLTSSDQASVTTKSR